MPRSSSTWSTFRAWGADPITTSDSQEFLKRRVALFFGVQCALSVLTFFLNQIPCAIEHGGPIASFNSRPHDVIGHLATILVLGAIWAVIRYIKWSIPNLYRLEGAFTILLCTSAGMSVTTSQWREAINQGGFLGWQMFLIVIIMLVARAALVPSSAMRSLLIGIISILPVALGTHYAVTAGQELSFWSSPTETPWNVFAWGVTFVIMTTVTSRIIYGLQARIQEVLQLGQYTLEEKLGEGGMGVVYRARHAMMRRPTAVKLLPQDKMGEQSLARFEREVQLTAQLTHPNTITIFDYGRTSKGLFYYAMELLDGATLEEIVERFGAQPPERVLHVLKMVSAALTEAHETGLIHRDIKPTNIFMCKQGGELDVAKVLDFGLVKAVDEPTDSALTQEGAICGTPHYMAPESVAAPEQVDGRGDLYALGAVGYYMLTGKVVFEGTSAVQVCAQHISATPPPPSERLGSPVPAELEAVIMSCLEKAPDARPQSAMELSQRLEASSDIDVWSKERARTWWEEHGEALQPTSPLTKSTEFADTIAVDFAQK